MGATGLSATATPSLCRWVARGRNGVAVAGIVALGMLAASPAQALPGTLSIDPTFDPSITGAANSAEIIGAVNAAIGTIEGLYTTFNSVTDHVYFTLGAGSFPATTLNGFFANSYSAYTNALKDNSTANPLNTVLATAIANLGKGNGANGQKDVVGTSGHLRSLGFQTPPCFNAGGGFNCGAADHPYDAIVTLNDDLLSFTRPPPKFPPAKFDALGVIEHQLNEVLGGGGAGSTLSQIALGPCPGNFFCDKLGALDLYRYDKNGKPSFTTGPGAASFFSIDGGTTSIIGFDQDQAGDFGDWGPNVRTCSDGSPGGPDALIQNAFICPNEALEDYTTGTPEYTMELSIGYDPKGVVPPPLPEPGSLALLVGGLTALGALRLRRV